MSEPLIEYFPLYEDDRGSVYVPMDNVGSSERSGGDERKLNLRRTYVVRNWSKGLVRAWHGHNKAWTGIHVIKGATKVVAKNIEDASKVVTKTLTDRKPGIFWVPPGWYNGAMSLEDDTRLLVYSTLSFEEVKGDDVRMTPSSEELRSLFQVKIR